MTRVFWALVIGFLAGIFGRSVIPAGVASGLFLVLLAAATLTLVPLRLLGRRHAIVVACFFAAVASGVMRMNAGVLVPDQELATRVGDTISVEGIVVDDPDVRDGSVRTAIATNRIGSSTRPVAVVVLASLPSLSAVSYGDRVTVTGTVAAPAPFETNNGRSFDYPGYLAARGISFELVRARITTIEGNEGNAIVAAAFALKHRYVAGTNAVLPEPEAGLANGIVVGDKRSVGPELTAAFQRVSLVHMLVLSGYNITIVATVAATVLAWAPRIARLAGSGAAVIFFVLAAGCAPSAVRAAGMSVLAMYASISGRRYVALRVLAAVCAAMILWNPYLLVFDPGFQLSALATLGLILLSPGFSQRLAWIPERFGLREIAATTISTQPAVLPLLLFQNGTLSLVSLPANVLALAVVPLAMLASFVAAIGGVVFGAWAIPLAAPAYVLLAYIIGVTHVFASLGFAAVSIPAFGAWILLPCYAALGFLAWSFSDAGNEEAATDVAAS